MGTPLKSYWSTKDEAASLEQNLNWEAKKLAYYYLSLNQCGRKTAKDPATPWDEFVGGLCKAVAEIELESEVAFFDATCLHYELLLLGVCLWSRPMQLKFEHLPAAKIAELFQQNWNA